MDEAQRIHDALEEVDNERSSVLVRSSSGKVLKDGKRYQVTENKNDGIVELNPKSDFKLSQSFISEYDFFKKPSYLTSLGLRKADPK